MRMSRTIGTFLAAFLVWGPATGAAPALEPAERSRSIVMNAVVEVSPERVFGQWLSREGVNRFFGEDAVIEPRVGGAYEIYFLPRTNPQSDANSTKGAKVLALTPGRELSFEWGYPPFAAELKSAGPTRVDLSFEALPGQPHRTHLHLEHSGFPRGGAWDGVYEFFVRAWSDILFRLERNQQRSGAPSR